MGEKKIIIHKVYVGVNGNIARQLEHSDNYSVERHTGEGSYLIGLKDIIGNDFWKPLNEK